MPLHMRPSLTAAKVARVVVFGGHHDRYAELLPDGAAKTTERLLLATGAMQAWMQRVYESRRYRSWLEGISDWMGPGQLARLVLRKRFMDDEVRSALADGATQILVVGAGYDTLCMRLAPRFPDREFVEVDHPGTHASKRAGIAALGATSSNLELISADLSTTSLVEALSRLERGTWDPEAKTVVVAEGLLMYLDDAAIERLFTSLHDLTGPGSRVAFTYMKCDAHGRAYAGRFGGLARRSLAWIGEPVRWCIADESALARRLDRFGWRYEPDPERFDLGLRYLVPAGIDDRGGADLFEFMAVAERDRR